jgi:hypothetical protein
VFRRLCLTARRAMAVDRVAVERAQVAVLAGVDDEVAAHHLCAVRPTFRIAVTLLKRIDVAIATAAARALDRHHGIVRDDGRILDGSPIRDRLRAVPSVDTQNRPLMDTSKPAIK